MTHALELLGAGAAGVLVGIVWCWLAVLRRVLGVRWWEMPAALLEAWRG